MTSLRWYLLGLLALFGGYVALEYYSPKPIDWTPTLSNKDKIPYGTYALFDGLPTLLGTEEVASVRQPIYNQLYNENEPGQAGQDPGEEAEHAAGTAPTADTAQAAADTVRAAAATAQAEADSTAALAASPADSLATSDERLATGPATYVFVNETFSDTELETQALRRFVAAGNDVFIAASFFGDERPGERRRPRGLLASLGIRQQQVPPRYAGQPGRADSLLVSFRDPALGGAALRLSAQGALTYFEAPGQPVAALATDEQGRAMLVRRTLGRGHFYLCSTPLAFSNYYLLPPRTRRFALAALSYLPTGRPVWWDEYQKQGRVGEQSVLRVLLNHEALRVAFYLLLATTLLFVLVEARRRQRVIPTIRPLPNTTLLFTRTVAGLYHRGRSGHQQIAEKRVALFLDYLRTRFQEPSPDLGEEAFRERLSQKAGLPRPRVDELLRMVNFARTAPVMTDQELVKLNRAIQEFKRASQ